MAERRPHPDDRPSDAVLDELLRAFEADDLTKGADVDLSSPEVEALLSGDQERPPDDAPAPSEEAGTAAAAETPDAGADDGVGEGVVRVIPVSDGARPADTGTHHDDRHDDDDRGGDDRGGDDVGPGGDAEPAEDRPAGHVPGDEDSGDDAAGAGGDGPRVVVIDADDGGDDPVYVEGNLAPEAPTAGADGSGTVFIDDDAMERADAVGSAEAARVTGIEPKLRERRVAVQRAEGRKRLRWALVAIGAVVVLIAGLIVMGSSLFTIGDVEVDGAVASEGETLEQIVDELGDENIWGVDLESYRQRIRRIPAVERVRVSKGFFGGATIEIDEREPSATFAGEDGRFRVIDAEGRVLQVTDERPADRPLIGTVEGEEPPNTEPGSFADPGFGNAGAYASMLTPAVIDRLEIISVARDGSDTRLHLQGGTEVLLGDGTDPVGKLARLENEIVRYDGDLPAQLDVSTDEVTNVPG